MSTTKYELEQEIVKRVNKLSDRDKELIRTAFVNPKHHQETHARKMGFMSPNPKTYLQEDINSIRKSLGI